MKPTQMDVEKKRMEARLLHRRRLEAIERRGLTGRARDSAIEASEAKMKRDIQKFKDTGDVPW